MNIKALIKRNLPVFAIGSLTIFVFLFIIFTSQVNNKGTPANLVEINSEELIAPHTYFKGPVNAPVTVVEFSDYECPACKLVQGVLDTLSNQYPDTLKWAFRHYPLPQHKGADMAAIAAQAAGEQGKFWQYSGILFENQGKFSQQDLVKYADLANLDINKFTTDMQNQTIKDAVKEDVNLGHQLGINGTPTIYLNGKMLNFESLDDVKTQIENELKKYQNTSESTQSTQTSDAAQSDQPGGQATQPSAQTGDQKILSQVYDILDKNFGVVQINYTDQGFEPKDTKATAGQLIKWTNKTDKDLNFVQIVPVFEELAKPFIIKPGESFEFRLRLRKTGLWTYRKQGEESRASILIMKINPEIEKLLPENIK